jgi:filamentous hemagglutinin family protein
LPPRSTQLSCRAERNPQFKAAKLFAALAIVGLAHQGMAAAPAPDALPTGGQVVAGSAVITSAGNTMNINQTSQRAVVNWSSFDVGSQAKVNFNQPNAAAATLNYVNSASKSMINGAVNANGQVIFVNNNGVVFGKGAEVNVGGMVATTMNTSAAEFMSGKDIQIYEGGSSGKVVNKGRITGNNINSYIVLMAPQVKNTGVITAAMSGDNAIALVSGQKVTLKFSGSQFVNVSVDASVVNALISNKLLINAGGGQVIIAANAAQNLMGSLIKNTGTISASEISTAGGKISLIGDTVEQNGVIQANSAQNAGGKISLMGNKITLASGSKTTATGATAGGEVCIGVNYSNGKNLQYSIQNNNLANEVTVESNSIIDVSAIQNGHGGSINIWSRNRTSVAGSLFAKGGALGGNGGFIETSSKGIIDLNQGLIVDTSSPLGRSGRWVIDPAELIIDSAAASAISNALNTTSVTLDATGSTCAFGSCTQSQSPLIRILADIYSGNTATSLNLIATGGQIDIDSNITAGAIYAVAQAINVKGSINTNGGSNSNIYLAGAIINILGNINSNGSSGNSTNSNNLNSINSTTENNRRNGDNKNTLNTDGNNYISNGGLINILASGDITINTNSYISTNGQNGGNITIVSTAGKTLINGIVDSLGISGNVGNIIIVGKVETNITGALINTEGLSQGGLLNLGQINNLGNGTILAPPATAPPAPQALLTFVQDLVTAAISNTGNSLNSITSNSIIIDSQTGINAPNGSIVVFGDQIQVNNSSFTATNGMIVIGREGYSSGGLSTITIVANTSLIANRTETSGASLGVIGNTVLASEWLLDPTTVTITNAATTSPGTLSSALANPGAVNISTTDIQNAINVGTSVNVIATGAITVSNALTFSIASGLTATFTLDNRATQGADIIVNASITSNGAGTLNLSFYSGGKIKINNDNTSIAKSSATANSIRSTSGKMNVTMQSFLLLNPDVVQGVYTANIYIYGNITTRGGFITLDGTGGSIATATSGSVIAGETITKGPYEKNGNIYLEYGTALNTLTDASTTVTASSTGGNINITASKGLGGSTGSFQQGILAPIYSGGTVNLNLWSYSTTGNVSYNFVVFNKVATSPIVAVNSINVYARSTQNTIIANSGAIHISSPWTSRAGSINIDNISSGTPINTGTSGIFNSAAISGATGVNITNSSIGAVGIDTSTAGSFTSSTGSVNLTNTSTGAFAGIRLLGAVSGNTGVAITNNSQSGAATFAGIAVSSTITSATGGVVINSTTTTGAAIYDTSTITAAAGISVVGSGLASTNGTAGAVSTLGAISNTGANGVFISSTGNTATANVSDSGVGGISITGGYGISAGTVTDGTITALGALTNTGGGIISLSMAQPTSTPGATGSIEAAAGITTANASIFTNVAYSLRGGVMSVANSTVNNVNYRSPLTLVAISVKLLQSYVTTYGVAFTDSAPQLWIKDAANSVLTISGAGAFGASPTVTSILGSLSLSSIGGVSAIAANRVGGPTTLVTGDIFSAYGVVTITAPEVGKGTYTVSPATLTITSKSTSSAYDGVTTFNALTQAGYSVAGLISTIGGAPTSDAVSSTTSTINLGASSGISIAGNSVATAGTYSVIEGLAQGSNLGNYAINYVRSTFDVTPASLTITATNDSKTYGSTTTNAGIVYGASGVKTSSAIGFTVAGLLGSDGVSTTTLTSSLGAIAIANASTTPYAITPSTALGNGLDNYTVTYINGALTVNKTVLIITNPTMVYNGTTTFAVNISGATATVTGVNGQTFTLAGSAPLTNGNVLGGSNIISTTGLTFSGDGSSNYALPLSIANVVITPAPLTVTLAPQTKTYDSTTGAVLTPGTASTNGSYTIAGFVSGQGAFITQTVGAYNSANASLSGITSSASTVSAALSPANWTAYSSTSLSNYSLPTTVSATGTINKAPLAILANDVSTFVNTQPAAGSLTYIVTGLVGTDTPVSAFSAGPTVALASDASLTTAGVFAGKVVPSVTAPNYTVTATPGILTVLGNNTILVSVGTTSKVYGTYNQTQVSAGAIQSDIVPIVTVQYKPAISGVQNLTVFRSSGIWTATDGISGSPATYTFTVTPTITSDSYSTADYLKVASYTLVPANLTLAANSPNNCGSCTVSYTSGTLTITPKALTATVTPSPTTYNGTTTINSTTSLSGYVGAASVVTGTTTLTVGAPNAGVETVINGGTVLSGPDAANYTVTNTLLAITTGADANGVVAVNPLANGNGYTINIAKAPLVYTGVDRASVYTSALQTNSGATLSSGTLYSTDAFTISGYATAANVITANQGRVADVLLATASSSTVANNYSITYNHGSLTITGAPLVITATSDTKTYGSTTTNAGIVYASGVKTLTADGYTVGGLIGSDVISSVTLSSSGALATANVVATANVAGSPYAIRPSVAASTSSLSNYTISYVDGVLTVNPAVLNIANATMVYNGTTTFAVNTSGATATVTGVNGQTFTLAGSAVMTNANVLGTSAINNTAGLTVVGLSGGDLPSNYALPVSIANVDVTPAPIRYTGKNTATVFNNTLQTNDGAILTAGTIFGSDAFTISGYATKTDVSRVGNSASGALSSNPDILFATATGATNPNNYSITYIQGGLTITPAPLTATVTPAALTYNGSGAIISTTVLSGFVGGAIDISGSTALTAGSPNAGVQIINNGGTTLSGSESLNYAVTNTVLASTASNGVAAVNAAPNGSGYTIDIVRRILGYTGQITTSTYSGVEQTNAVGTLTTGTIVSGESFTLGGYAKATNVSQGTVVDQLAATPGANTLAANYEIRYINGSITITPKQLSVTMTPPSGSTKVYDSTTAATLTAGTSSNAGSYAVTGFVSGQGAYITQAAGTYNSANVAGATTITAALTPSVWTATGSAILSNYVLPTTVSATGTITPASLSITANDAATFVGVAPTNLTYVINGLVGTDTPGSAFSVSPTVTLASGASLTTAGVFSGKVVPSVTAPNYIVTPISGVLTVVGNSILVVSVGTTSQVFGTYNQIQVEDGTISKVAPNVTVGYCTNCTDVNITDSTRTIVNLTVVAPTAGTTNANTLWTAYDGISGAGSNGVTNAQGKYNFTVTPTVVSGNYSSGNYLKVGNYALVPGNVTTVSGFSTNYQGAPIYTSGALTITPLTLTFNSAVPTQTYNGLTAINNLVLTPNNLPTGITGITSVVGNGNFTSPNSSTAAVYTINNALITGADAANFAFAGASGSTGVINKAQLVYTGVANTSVFNGATQTNNGATLTSGTIATGESFTLGGYAQQRGVLASATLDALVASPSLNTSASNYQITFISGSLRITPAPLTARVTAAGLTYNGSTAISSTTALTGFVGGATDVTGATTLTALLADAGIQTIVNGGTVLSGPELANYSITNTVLMSTGSNGVAAVNAAPNGSGYKINIAKAPLTYTSADTSVTYNGTLQTKGPATLTSGSIVTGQGFTLTGYAAGTTVNETPFDDLIATERNGTNPDNYSITLLNGSMKINPAPLTISGLAANNKTYDGNTNAVIVGTPVLNGQIVGDTVAIGSGSITQGVFASPTVSRNPISVSVNLDGLVLSNPNYYIQRTALPLSARINAALTTPAPPAQPATPARPVAQERPNNMVMIANQSNTQVLVQSAEAPTKPELLIKGEMLYVRDSDNSGAYLQALPVPSSGAFKFPVPDQITQELIEMTGEHISVSGTPASFGGHKLLMYPNQATLKVTLEDGSELPSDIRFNPVTRIFSIAKISQVTLPISVKLSLVRGNKTLSQKVMVVTK